MSISTRPLRWAKFPRVGDYEFWDDFDDELALTSNLPVAASSSWIGTALSSGTFAQSTDERYGVAVLSGAATTDNSGAQIQSDMEQVSFVTGKTVEFMARLKLSDATESEGYAGVGITDTTFLDGTGTLAAGLTHTDSVGFYKPDGQTQWVFVVRRDSVNVFTLTIDSAVDATYQELAFRVDMDPSVAGKGQVEVFVDGVSRGRSKVDTMPYDTEEIFTPTVALVSGNNTGTKTLTIDCIGVLQERAPN